jgi:hypothetical protein
MNNLQKIGGIAALIGAATNLFALVVFATILVPNGFGAEPRDVGKIVAFLRRTRRSCAIGTSSPIWSSAWV